MRRVLFASLCLLLAAPVSALDDQFVDSSWDTSTWLPRRPLSGSQANTGVASVAAMDGFQAELIYPGGRPESEWGPRYSSQIMSVEQNLYGDYEARLRSGDAADTEGLISAFFIYENDETDWDGDGMIDNHEIDIELPNSDQSGIFLSVYTDYQYVGGVESFNRVGARVDMATGEVWATAPGGQGTWDLVPQPPLDFSVPGFSHREQFYTYGFEWREDRVTFWIDLEDGAGARQLFEVRGSALDDIPSRPAATFFNVWHTTVDWWSRAEAPPVSNDATMAIDYVSVGPPGLGCETDAECDDFDPCNGAELCSDGDCVSGTPVDCSDAAGVCTNDVCLTIDSSTWECAHDPISCDDGNACTVNSCDPISGCASTPVYCAEGYECRAGTCVEIPMCLGRNARCSSNSDCCSGKCRGKRRRRCR